MCGNKNPYAFGVLNGKPYCRACITFKTKTKIELVNIPKRAPIFINYALSKEQEVLSDQLIINYDNKIDTLVHAVCGSGKTEISLGIIQHVMEQGGKVAFAVPRKDVVIELFARLNEIFKKNKVIALYGGNHEEVDGDLIVLTTHQLYRYEHFFSLIVLDEIDAFPFKGNEVLRNIFFNSLKGNFIFMSATPTKDALELFKGENKAILRLDSRFHKHPLPVPVIYKANKLFMYLKLIAKLKDFTSKNKPVFIFCPTIDNCENTYRILSFFVKGGRDVHSKKIDRIQIVEGFRNKKFKYLVTTSILERGVTVANLQVIIFNADNSLYDKNALVQIAGRVGRKREAPDGEVIFICNKITKEMNDAIEDIRYSNKSLQNML